MLRFKGRSLATGVRLLTVGAVAAGTLALTSGVASAAGLVSASPNSNLVNHEKVTVSVAPNNVATPGDPAAVVECNPKAQTEGQAACDTAHPVLTTVGPDGSFSVVFHVRTGPIGDGTCGTNTSDRVCILAAADVPGGNPNNAVPLGAAPIYFRVPTVQLSQSAFISDGEPITVKGSYFPKNDANLAIVECSAKLFTDPNPFNACDVPAGIDVSSGPLGSVHSTFTMLTTSYSDADGGVCSGGATCYVAIGDKNTFQGGIAAFQSAP